MNEHSVLGTFVGKVESYDYDENDAMSVVLDDDADGRFSLGPITCENSTTIPVRSFVII